MNKNRYLLLEERNIIEQKLNESQSFQGIGRELCKDATTIAKEVKNHIQFRKTGCYGKPFNDCQNRKGCTVRNLCGNRRCGRYCCFCSAHPCSSLCPDHQKEVCSKLSRPPYACNGCEIRRSCTLEKRLYSAIHAQKEYEVVRSESRQGVQLTQEDALRLDSLISPLLLKGQSLHHISINHTDEIMLNIRTLYNM